MRQTTLTRVGAAAAAILSVAGFGLVVLTTQAATALNDASYKKEASLSAAAAIASSSALLTNSVRAFTATGNQDWIDKYWSEINTTQSQAKAIRTLTDLGTPQEELDLLREASGLSGNLVATETRAMRLVFDAKNVDTSAMPKAVASYDPSPGDRALKPAGKIDLARTLVHDSAYAAEVAKIMTPITKFNTQLRNRVQAAVQDADDRRTICERALLVLSLTLAGLLVSFLLVMHRQVGRVITNYAAKISDRDPRDMALRLTPAGVLETQQMARAFNMQSDQVADLITQMADDTDELAAAATELQGVAEDMARSAAESDALTQEASNQAAMVAENVSTVAAGTEEMGASISEIATASQNASQVAQEAVLTAADTSVTVGQLGESSALIGEVVKVITSIAEQTNLLALNATIEAARAGEAGKGFAVVANEVKDLAQQTSAATEDISGRVAGIQRDSTAAAAALADITDVISRINDTQTTIASAVEEQTATTNEMGRSVREAADGSTGIASSTRHVAESSAKTSLGITESRAAAERLSTLAISLRTKVSEFSKAV